MFKPGEVAGVRVDGRHVIVKATLPKGKVDTDAGIFKESELLVAHPTVLATASGKKAVELSPDEPEDTRYTCLPDGLLKAAFDRNEHTIEASDILFFGKVLKKDFGALSECRADAWYPVHVPWFARAGCRSCGKHPPIETNGVSIRAAGSPCSYPLGVLTTWEINVPSGVLVVANDLRKLFPLTSGDFDICTTHGLRQTSLAYADVGLAHAFVGNTCPSVRRAENGGFIVICEQTYKWDEETQDDIEVVRDDLGEAVASICTDLWWYSICDHDEYCRRVSRFGGDYNVQTVVVEPGVYRFSHNDLVNRDSESDIVFTTIERVRDPDPVKDLLSQYDNAEIGANAYVQAMVEAWPTLYGGHVPWADMTEESRLQSWQSVADSVFLVTGSGDRWHEKGFPIAAVDPSIPDIDPPSFRAQYPWYPFFSLDYTSQKVLAPSFAKLAFRVLESIISFGTPVQVRDGVRRSREDVKRRMLQAVKCYRQLSKRYPDLADPEYVSWLRGRRAEAWVANFDLGESEVKQ